MIGRLGRFLLVAIGQGVIGGVAFWTVANAAEPGEGRQFVLLAIWPLVIVAGTAVLIVWLLQDKPVSASPTRRIDPNHDRRLRRAIDTLITWLYRRENWSGLSNDGRYLEPAPSSTWTEDRYRVLDLADLGYEPPSAVPAEPGYHPEPATTSSLPRPIEPRPEPKPPLRPEWLSDPDDLRTLALKPEHFEAALEAARRLARDELAEDAEVMFTWVDLSPEPEINFSASSEIARRTLGIAVGAKTPRIFSRDKKRRSLSADSEAWRVDTAWDEVVRKSWQRERPAPGTSITLWPDLHSPIPGRSRWFVMYRRSPDAAEITYALEGGKLVEVPS